MFSSILPPISPLENGDLKVLLGRPQVVTKNGFISTKFIILVRNHQGKVVKRSFYHLYHTSTPYFSIYTTHITFLENGNYEISMGINAPLSQFITIFYRESLRISIKLSGGGGSHCNTCPRGPTAARFLGEGGLSL